MLESQQHLRELRWRLVDALRDETIALDDPALAIHLRETVMGQLAIDQPNYPALKKARAK